MAHALRFSCLAALAASALVGAGGGCLGSDPATGGNDAAVVPGVDGAAPSPDLSAGSDTCFPATTMIDTRGAPGAGAAYPKPTLSWACVGNTFVVDTNGITPYTFVQTTPNALAAKALHRVIPLHASPAANATSLPMGYVGFAVNGMTFYSPSEAAQPANQAYGDPVYNSLLDECMGHTSPNDYHYHAFSEKCMIASALVERPWMNAEPDATKPSPVLGWAADGYPVYGPRECTDANCARLAVMQSGYKKIGDPTMYASKAYQFVAHAGDNTFLDECNGHVGPKGDYHYHSTLGYPYIINCFHGTPMGVMGGNPLPDAGTPPATDGAMPPPGDASMPMGPKACTMNADCAGACPPNSKGCTCAMTMMGQLCVPTCTIAADCPPGPMGMVLTCRMGTCAP